MHRALVTLTIAAAVGLAAAPATAAVARQSEAADSADSPAVVEQLFVQTARAGSLVPVKGDDGVFTLTLRGVSPEVVTFTDRPARVAANLPTSEFVGTWDDGPFTDDPPNAALVLDGAPDGKDVFVFELAKPRYDEGLKTLKYQATEITEGANGRLAGFADSVDEAAATKFGRASLFVDALPSEAVTVELANVPPDSFLNASFGNGFEFADTEQTVTGDITAFITAANAWGVFAAGSVPATGTINGFFCAPPGVSSVPLQVHGSGTVTITFYGEAAQTFGPGSQTLQVPAAAQQQGCAS
jgi:hypothetical protein